MKLHRLFLTTCVLTAGIIATFARAEPLIEARAGFHTKLVREVQVGEAPETPPAKSELKLVSYPGPLGKMAAYVGPIASDGKRHPAIIWLVGGFSNSISEIAWTPGPVENDQSASGFRDAGIVMMYPSLRGGNTNPGHLEAFYGEVDDVIAAAAYLAKQDFVDPKRVYLGGHSTGGTLALLVAETTDQFRAIFALGPVEDVAGYGEDVLPVDILDKKEIRLRSPQYWLQSIVTPTFVFEGADGRSNIRSLHSLEKRNHNSLVTFIPIPNADHFGTIHPLVQNLARKIQDDTGEKCNMSFDPAAPLTTK